MNMKDYKTFDFDYEKIKDFCYNIETTREQIKYLEFILKEYEIAGEPLATTKETINYSRKQKFQF